MPGKKPKERQRYMLRVNDTLVEVTRAAWRNYRKKATTALFRYYHRKKSLSGCQRYRNSKKL